MRVESVHIDGYEKNYGPLSIQKFENVEDEFTFDSHELRTLCGGDKFHPDDIEIIELVGQWMRFLFLRRGTYLELYFNVTFSSDEDTQRFFKDIRPLRRIVNFSSVSFCYIRWHRIDEFLLQRRLVTIDIPKMFRYPILRDAPQNGVPTLTPFSRDVTFYVRNLDRDWFENPRSFNFVRIVDERNQEADLVFQSMKFNITPGLDNDKYILCANTIEYSYYVYVLFFADETIANKFYELVIDDVDRQIPCSNDWLTPELARQMHSPFSIPHLPRLRD